MKDELFLYNARRSLGFVWDLPSEGLHILRAEDAKDALFTFHKYRVEHVSSTLRTMEHIPCTNAQTRTILDGKTVSGLTTFQLRTIENYGKACERLVTMIEDGRFSASKDNLCELHGIIGRDEAKHCGMFRGHQVFIEQSHYLPPKSEHLDRLFTEGRAFLQSLDNIQERAICTFLFLARSQFFSDCNKRTANLAMNGILMQNGFHPLTIESEHFLEKMAQFYETAIATDVINEINSIAKKQYHIDGAKLELETDTLHKEQSSISDVITQYTETLKAYIQAKQAQIERIEAAFEATINKQQQKLTQLTTKRPGFISSLWKGAEWKREQEACQTRLTSLERRLSRVKKIRNEGALLVDLAETKLRHREPELTKKRDALLQEQRLQTAAEHIKNCERSQNVQTQGRGRQLER